MTSPFGDTDWRAMSQQQRDVAFNNVAAVPDSARVIASWDERSANVRTRPGAELDRVYGPRPRNRFDVFKAVEGGPTLVFIHGGYWQTRAKESFACFAEGPLAHGINVALVGYTLAPEATLDQIVAEIHLSLDVLSQTLPSLGGDPARIVVAGWSAGGHLTAMALSHPAVKAGMAISGLYDLEPVRHCYVNDKLGLDEATARRLSPQRLAGGVDKPLSMVVGSAELPLLRLQTAQFAAHRALNALPVTYEELPGHNHFSILDEMASPNGRITTLIRQLVERIAV